jgi:hypothetical protein
MFWNDTSYSVNGKHIVLAMLLLELQFNDRFRRVRASQPYLGCIAVGKNWGTSRLSL